jgi:hypothetical protein
MTELTSSSRLLEKVLDRAPVDDFTLAWLLSALQRRSFDIVLLFLGLLATVPIGSTVPGLILAAVAVQMIAGRRELVFPYFITVRRLPARYLIQVGKRAIPVLRYLEKTVHPRWPTMCEMARPLVGITILLLTAILLLTPVPLSNVAPATVIALIALAYIQEDGLLLCSALLAAAILIGGASLAVWGTILSAILVSRS